MTIAAKPRVDFWRVLFGTFFLALAAFTLKEIFFAGPSINPERNITVWGERLAIAARNRAQFEPEPRLEYSVRIRTKISCWWPVIFQEPESEILLDSVSRSEKTRGNRAP